MLTPSQLTALKANILATPELASQPDNGDGHFAIAAYYNILATPAFIVWRTNVPTKDVRSVLVWSEYDALTVSKQNAFSFLVSNGTVDASLTNVRQGIASIFSGPGQAGNLAALTAISKRSATRAEKLFATGVGTDATPATLTFEGSLTFQDVEAARHS